MKKKVQCRKLTCFFLLVPVVVVVVKLNILHGSQDIKVVYMKKKFKRKLTDLYTFPKPTDFLLPHKNPENKLTGTYLIVITV
jgi:hypothetical protein